jgi:hypothetical protein
MPAHTVIHAAPGEPGKGEVRVVRDWVAMELKGELSLVGYTVGWAGWKDGTDVVTTRITHCWETELGHYVRTRSGSTYRLGRVDREWAVMHPQAYQTVVGRPL